MLAVAVTVGCGARTELGDDNSDTPDATQSGDTGAGSGNPCSSCGGMWLHGGPCTNWFFCASAPPPDAAVIRCEDAPYAITCSCETNTCTCSLNGNVYRVVPGDCTTCGQYPPALFVAPDVVAACNLGP